MKFNILNHAKKILIGFGAAVLVGIIILCVFGFNLGPELKGYIELRVELGQFTASSTIEHSDYDKYSKELVKLLKNEGAKVYQTNIEGTYDTFVIEIKKISKDRAENTEYADKLADKLENYYDNELLVVTTGVVDKVMTNVDCVRVAYTILITAIVALIYLGIRLKLLNSICVLATTFATSITFLTLLLITRVQINTSIFPLLILTTILALILSTMKVSKYKNEKIEFNSNDVGEIKLKTPLTITFAILILAMICPIIFGSMLLRHFAIACILALISVWACENVVCMPLCYYLNNYTVPKKKEEKIEQDKEIVEVIDSSNENKVDE